MYGQCRIYFCWERVSCTRCLVDCLKFKVEWPLTRSLSSNEFRVCHHGEVIAILKPHTFLFADMWANLLVTSVLRNVQNEYFVHRDLSKMGFKKFSHYERFDVVNTDFGKKWREMEEWKAGLFEESCESGFCAINLNCKTLCMSDMSCFKE